ncbi:hypothetical protein JQ557_33310 [Bradyrhizobium sp. U87765 SZCCT0131]|uniref:hypothetical protein n=1 Tax=unclassified Bradyrhizobium TaxID=2631580 RepID=UPI001BA6D0D5|nr:MULTISPECIES: hypothetical protein [unclassified Bradyrhizobium]MBR1222921.1 hypothetical protein [Bradyrhizobium sp. U87765 SZCCT0131]MBR1262657.1 hypothetical protein [Bradyrhizobium sp. U87765 SZCCT0134]MBR1308871.1 hypothetical protein [Bradyrhizobium sp. U87765 SZCCT0110]MBR1318439.1 hypothetical protein [Bradyrhizobium sp. U87765 SZCCT0109]MBR1352143.1 hypothetical protein [Bradyrhizobium sp. U87765 SZCCT0048]
MAAKILGLINMSWLGRALDSIQKYASIYFQTVFKTSISFWDMPPLPSGANILTGAFSIFLILASRFERSLPTDMAAAQVIFPLLLVYVLFIGGISLFADPGIPNRIVIWRRLVSVVVVAISLGCGLVALAWIVEWTLPLDYLAYHLGFSGVGANRVLAAVTGAIVSIILFANTAYNVGGVAVVWKSRRTMVWSGIFFCIVSVGISLALLDIP